MSTTLKPGDKAPDFKVKNQDGEEVSLKDFKGKKLVLYFYPNDDTATCTNEACNLRDNYADLKKMGYEVLGISNNDVKSHRKFAAKYGLEFNLGADTEKKLVDAYGVYGDKVLFGKPYVGIFRTTFIINEKGVIEKIIDKVVSKNHAAQILAS